MDSLFDWCWAALERTHAELVGMRAEADTLRTKLEMPCGSCHPCNHWSSPDRVELRAALRDATALLRALVDDLSVERNCSGCGGWCSQETDEALAAAREWLDGRP